MSHNYADLETINSSHLQILLNLFGDCDDSIKELILRVLEKIIGLPSLEDAFDELKRTVVLCINCIACFDMVSVCWCLRVLVVILKHPTLIAEFLQNNGFESILQLSKDCKEDASLLILKIIAIISEVRQ